MNSLIEFYWNAEDYKQLKIIVDLLAKLPDETSIVSRHE
jgi:hypothetical protein